MLFASIVSLCEVVATAVAQGAGAVLESRLSQTPIPGSVERVPQYVLDYAPVIYLHSDERYLPMDFTTYLNHSHPSLNFEAIKDAPSPLTLDNLSDLNTHGDDSIALETNDDFTQNPAWIRGTLPNADGKTDGATTSAVIINHKGNSIVDAFYLFFYGFNQGNKLFGLSSLANGNHVSDWEHVMIRFKQGTPQSVYYSQHGAGTAYTYAAVEKHPGPPHSSSSNATRIVGYAGNGTHATWATPGTHSHLIPYRPSTWGAVTDHTDRGTLWDPLQSAYFYAVAFPQLSSAGVGIRDVDPVFKALPDPFSGTAMTSTRAPTNWLYYRGRWGNRQLRASDPRQGKLFFGVAWRYTTGPTGPVTKDLNRESVCKRQEGRWWPCKIREKLMPGS